MNMQIYLFKKITTFESVLISKSCTLYDVVMFHGDPRLLSQNLWGRESPTPQGLTPILEKTREPVNQCILPRTA